MVSAYLKSNSEKFGSSRVTLSEFDSANGVADLVEITLRRDWAQNMALGGINPRWAYALAKLPYRRIFSVEDFITLTGFSKNTALTVLTSFSDKGFCTKGSLAGTWIKLVQPKPLAKEIIAIEAKLINWRRALSQAYRYLDYAHRSWVLLDAARSGGALENIDRFQRLNIGLMIYQKNGVVKRIYSPQKAHPRNLLRFWQANSELGRSLKVRRVITV